MKLTRAQRDHFRKVRATSRESADVAAFLAAFVFPVSVPLALFATIELGRVVERLANDLPRRPDHDSRTTIGVGRMSDVVLPDAALAVAPDLTPATTTERGGWSSPATMRTASRTAYFTAIAADEAVYWLTAARRAEERSASVPDHPTSQLSAVRGQEAKGYYVGASDWLRAYDIRALGNWARLASARLLRECERVKKAKIGSTPLRAIVQANLERHDIAPLRPAEVARVFTADPAATVAANFDFAVADQVLERADGELSMVTTIFAEHINELRLLKPTP